MDPSTKSADVATFQLKLDSAGYTLIASLLEVVKSGGQARLAVDNKIMESIPGIVNYLRQAGVQIRFYNPINIKFSHLMSPIESFNLFNQRFHIKAFIVNGKYAISGDKNGTLKSYHLVLPLTKDQTTMLGKEFLVDGKAAQALSQQFQQIWDSGELQEIPEKAELSAEAKAAFEKNLSVHSEWLKKALVRKGQAWKQNAVPYTDSKVLFNNSDGTTMDQVLDLIAKVPDNSRVYIENPYFILYPKLEKTLRDLRQRNVRVVLVLNSPEVADIKLVSKALKVDLPKLLEMGIEVELIDFKRRITHGKLILIGENTVITGSGNFDPRSYNINLELNLQIESPALNQQLWQQFESTRHTRSRAVRTGVSCSQILNSRTYLSQPVSWPVRYIIELARPYL